MAKTLTYKHLIPHSEYLGVQIYRCPVYGYYECTIGDRYAMKSQYFMILAYIDRTLNPPTNEHSNNNHRTDSGVSHP